ncbi:MAG: hypothetical protein RLZZ450_56 [Pseudomonadota bacterium]|jgi:phage-related protein (TIGR01555 family)
MSNLPALRDNIQNFIEKFKSKAVMDGFANAMTGLGTSRDKTTFSAWVADPPLMDDELEAVYESNDLAQVIVDKIVDDSLREPFTIKMVDGEPDEDEGRYIMKRWTELQGKDERFKRGCKWGRLFGGGGVIVVAKSGTNTSRAPLLDEKVTEVVKLIDFDKQQMQPYTFNTDGSVRTFLYTPVILGMAAGTNVLPIEVHTSRVILCPGASTTNKARQANEGWDHSVLKRVRAALLSFDGMWKSVDNMFSDASQAVFKMQGLIQSLAEDTGPNAVQVRLQLMDRIRSVARAIILDAGDEQGNGAEDFELKERASLGGLDGVIGQYMVRLATAARMPLTVLLGMAPAGMDATGESDMVLYFNTVDIYRQNVLQERIERILNMLALEYRASAIVEDAFSKLESGEEPDDSDEEETGRWCIEWPELARPKPIDVATAENMRITSAMQLVDGTVIQAEELALRLSDVAARGITALDLNLQPRRAALEAAHEEVANREVGLGKAEATAAVETENAIKVEKSKPKSVGPKGKAPAGKMSKRKTPSKAAKRQV